MAAKNDKEYLDEVTLQDLQDPRQLFEHWALIEYI